MDGLTMLLAAVLVGAAVAVAILIGLRRPAAQAPVVPTDQAAINQLLESVGRLEAKADHTKGSIDTVRVSVDLLGQNNGRRGAWGEVTLRRILETAGLMEKVDFDVQWTVEGKRPDAVLHLPNGGQVMVDAKTPFDDLRRAETCTDEKTKQTHLRAHATAVRRHATDLARRNYAGRVEATFTAVVMYIPVEGAWHAALEVDPDLVGDLYRMGIHPASPQTLGLVLEVLKQYALHEGQTESVKTIIKSARTVIERLATHAEHLDRVGTALNKAVEEFNKAAGNLVSRVAPATRDISAHLGMAEPTEVKAVESVAHPERVRGLSFSGEAA